MIRESIFMALNSIRSNKMRSFLTMLGIIIGIASVIAITAIGASAQALMNKEFDSFGKNRVLIYGKNSLYEEYPEKTGFTMDDIDHLKETFSDTITYIAPSASMRSEVKMGRAKAQVDLTATDVHYDQFMKLKLIHGRFFSPGEIKGQRSRIVVDEKLAKRMFGKSDIVGRTLEMTVGGQLQEMMVVGVYSTEKSLFAGMGQSDSTTAYIPYTMMTDRIGITGMLDFFMNPDKEEGPATQSIMRYLERTKGVPSGSYGFESTKQQGAMINKVLGTLSAAIGAIAAISLLVGGIGIMNIMLVSVTERTREIGIRKSLGARTRDILMQFLMESMILSVIGGLIGTALGLGLGRIGATVAKVALVTNPAMIGLAIAFSAFVGIFFGIYPARKAAKLDPIDALRYE